MTAHSHDAGKWEYLVIRSMPEDTTEERNLYETLLDESGMQGWELIHVGRSLIFKRRIYPVIRQPGRSSPLNEDMSG